MRAMYEKAHLNLAYRWLGLDSEAPDHSTFSKNRHGRFRECGALKRILDRIPIGLSEFFALEPEKKESSFYRSDELTEIGKGRISYRQIGDNLFGRALQILSERYEPGADTGRRC